MTKIHRIRKRGTERSTEPKFVKRWKLLGIIIPLIFAVAVTLHVGFVLQYTSNSTRETSSASSASSAKLQSIDVQAEQEKLGHQQHQKQPSRSSSTTTTTTTMSMVTTVTTTLRRTTTKKSRAEKTCQSIKWTRRFNTTNKRHKTTTTTTTTTMTKTTTRHHQPQHRSPATRPKERRMVMRSTSWRTSLTYQHRHHPRKWEEWSCSMTIFSSTTSSST
mmetsp:Transcript_17358/g.42179  ORF Transcript_17358/g.42179 Transcript_17358/m.42179 type:complete len:218 (-) Transcript_17358:1493-2146(-)